jgi:hypothetical protein
MGTGRWKFPAVGVDDLYYVLHQNFTDPEDRVVTVDIFMLDTVQWAGLEEDCYRNLNTTDAEMMQLWERFESQPMGVSFDDARGSCLQEVHSTSVFGSGQNLTSESCCLVDKYYSNVPAVAIVSSWEAQFHAAGTQPLNNTCDEASWPSKDHGLVCGECKVLVDGQIVAQFC